jgi:hypothetical protein
MQTQLGLANVIGLHNRSQSYRIRGRSVIILAAINGQQGGLLRRLMSDRTKYCICH